MQLVSARATLTATNSQFHKNDYGINLVDRGKLAIRGRFTNKSKTVIHGSPGSTRHRPETVVISDNVFANNHGCMNLRLSGRTNLRLVRNTFESESDTLGRLIKLTIAHSELTVQGNRFFSVYGRSLNIWPVNSRILITNDTREHSELAIRLYNAKTNHMTIEKNVFHANDCGNNGCISLYYGGTATERIKSNVLTNNRGIAVVRDEYWNIHKPPVVTPL